MGDVIDFPEPDVEEPSPMELLSMIIGMQSSLLKTNEMLVSLQDTVLKLVREKTDGAASRDLDMA